jgi:hypothetical protein
MTTATRLLPALALLGLAACSKPAPTATTPAEETLSAPVSATTPSAPVIDTAATVQKAVEDSAASLAAAAREQLAKFQLPDFTATTSSQLAALAAQTLTQWSQTIETPPAAISTEVEAVKGALGAEQPLVALASLAKLGDYAKTIPGGDALLQSSKQLVGAWALKQGFDPARISGALGALQKGDYAGLATQAAALFAKGGVNTEQKSILDGVLGSFGIDAVQAGAAVNAVRGLFGN